jgi:hypothetical protein
MVITLGFIQCVRNGGGIPPLKTKRRGPPPPLSYERQAPTPLRLHAHGRRFSWSHDGTTNYPSKSKGGVGAPHVPGGVPTPPPLKKMRGGPPTPHSFKRQGPTPLALRETTLPKHSLQGSPHRQVHKSQKRMCNGRAIY